MLNRRRFLKAVGTAAMSAGTAHLFPARPASAQRPFVIKEDRFGRIFPNLPPFDAHITPDRRQAFTAALQDIGRSEGMLDARDALKEGPIKLITEPELSLNNPNNPTMTAGATFMGQFMDHDMTFDLTSRLGVPTNPADSANSRTPAFDLDSVYGAGPGVDTQLYATGKSGNATKFKIENGGLFEDVPRNRDRSAIISDPRNDENIVISGLQAAFLLFHNRVVDLINAEDPNKPANEVFHEARQLTTWHYQWMVVHEFLPKFVGQAIVDDVMRNGRKFYTPPVPQIPVEFQGAAYRFGHSMVRPSYRANLAGDKGQPFFALTFDPTQEGETDPNDLRGGCRAPRRFIGWQTFFDFGSIPRPAGQGGGFLRDDVRPNKLIDTHISTPLFDLPIGAIASGQPPTSLPERNLLRQVTWGLPSGQSIAQAIGVPMLSKRDLAALKDYRLGLDESTPLWFYVLKEAELMASGLHLGPVGGRIVGEVILGLIALDRDSYVSSPGWQPTLPTVSGQVTGDFRMIDFLTFAKVDPTSRGQ